MVNDVTSRSLKTVTEKVQCLVWHVWQVAQSCWNNVLLGPCNPMGLSPFTYLNILTRLRIEKLYRMTSVTKISIIILSLKRIITLQ